MEPLGTIVERPRADGSTAYRVMMPETLDVITGKRIRPNETFSTPEEAETWQMGRTLEIRSGSLQTNATARDLFNHRLYHQRPMRFRTKNAHAGPTGWVTCRPASAAPASRHPCPTRRGSGDSARTREVTVYQTIQTLATDPDIVAAKVVGRIVQDASGWGVLDHAARAAT
ncbi:hypothetical protein [Nonomuraea typhae]|uniref:Uncharacterized protein n=1 Tax=Nonomuraea typhae TaxID=2603600 RepID=A0ABW7YLR6_9ACTN